ncbi:glutamate receptor ionotropic, NMDA 3A-like [Clytia hemisphaerica]|uniref:glutamate receptor ionotropic, NMDA 3A-like n=1 Tax=Clytia hemisphaerica TaxID=252671 RepID=UPI0034D74183
MKLYNLILSLSLTITKVFSGNLTCHLEALLYPLELISKSTFSPKSSWLDPDQMRNIYFNQTNDSIGLEQWLHNQQHNNTNKQSIQNLHTFSSALTKTLNYILQERTQQEILILTDYQPTHLFLKTLEQQLLNLNYKVDFKTINKENIHQLNTIVTEMLSASISVNLLLLPWDLTQAVLDSAKRQFLLDKVISRTWITFNGDRMTRTEKCVHDISIKSLVQSTYVMRRMVDSTTVCELKINDTLIESNGRRLVDEITECSQKRPKLVITTLIDHPFVITTKMDIDPLGGYNCQFSYPCSLPRTASNGTIVWELHCCAGLVIDIIMEIQKELNFDMELYGCPDRQYGSIKNGSWTGMVNEVASGRADLAIQGLTVNAMRSSVVDFTTSFMLTSIGIVRRRRSLQLPIVNWEFMKMLKLDLVLCLISSFAIVFVILFIYENINHYLRKDRYYPTREAFSYVAGLTFQRDLAGKTPHKWSARVVAIVYAIAMTIVMTTYTANLTANNLTEADTDDFAGLKDSKITNPTPAFIYGVRKGTFNELYFKENIQPRLSEAYQTFIRYYLTKTNSEGLENVRIGTFDAFVGDYVYLLYRLVTPKYCSVLSIHKESSLDFPLGFAVQKNSKWNKLISGKIRELHENGLLDRIVNKWFFLPKCLQDSLQAYKFPWEYIGGMLVAVAFVVLISIAVVCLETIYTRRKSKKTFGHIGYEFHGIFRKKSTEVSKIDLNGLQTSLPVPGLVIANSNCKDSPKYTRKESKILQNSTKSNGVELRARNGTQESTVQMDDSDVSEA